MCEKNQKCMRVVQKLSLIYILQFPLLCITLSFSHEKSYTIFLYVFYFPIRSLSLKAFSVHQIFRCVLFFHSHFVFGGKRFAFAWIKTRVFFLICEN